MHGPPFLKGSTRGLATCSGQWRAVASGRPRERDVARSSQVPGAAGAGVGGSSSWSVQRPASGVRTSAPVCTGSRALHVRAGCGLRGLGVPNSKPETTNLFSPRPGPFIFQPASDLLLPSHRQSHTTTSASIALLPILHHLHDNQSLDSHAARLLPPR